MTHYQYSDGVAHEGHTEYLSQLIVKLEAWVKVLKPFQAQFDVSVLFPDILRYPHIL